jgi:membrane fusion protein (multidrug efflux system)
MNQVTHIEAADAVSVDTDGQDHAEATAQVTAQKAKRKKLFLMLAAGVALAGGGYYAYETLYASHHVVTDNAYVGANVAQVTPLVGGPVREILVDETQTVHRGDVLVRLDDTDARLALARAEADLASTERRFRGIVATDSGLGAQVSARVADQARASANLAAAEADLAKARIDLDRRRALAASGSVSGDELTVAQNAFSTATANLKATQAAQAAAAANHDAAIQAHAANNALVADTSVETNPEVLAARAARDQAQVDLDRTVIRAPIDGVITRRQVQVGQRVQAGATLMTVTPIQQAYVDANFKEVQLAKVRPGQPVKLEADLYGGKVEYTGRVVGFSGGTGAAFAVVPAQNATGNWIKVVQRLPVRIALDPGQLAAHPLRVGLSMNTDINVGG